MKKSVFNLKTYFKKAFYEGAQGYWQRQSRAWANCYKLKSDKGMPPQKAWNSCMEEYNNLAGKGKWALNYCSDNDKAKKPYLDAKTPAVKNKK